MPYQGNTPAENYVVTVKDSFSGNGAATAFTLSQPTVTNDVRVVVENVVQDPTVAYAVSGTTLTFTSAPVSGTNNIYVIHLGPAVQQVAPPSTISNATTFESNVSVQGLFNSVGIDDNADATAITIDSSEVVLVGKTSNTFSQQGVALRANNDSQITRDGGHPLSLNRTTNDGAILNLYKAGTTVGSIGVADGDNLTISSTASAHGGLKFNNTAMAAYVDGASSNGTMSIGTSAVRFKDLYLSGGVYLGGTGSDNKLEDYETGSASNLGLSSDGTGFTSSGVTFGGAKYVKIGALVNVRFSVTFAGTSGNWTAGDGFYITGMPFTNNSIMSNGSCWASASWTAGNRATGIAMAYNNSTAYVGIEYGSSVARSTILYCSVTFNTN